MFRFLRPAYPWLYLLVEQDELTQDGHRLQVLRESPPVVSEQVPVEVRVEEHRHDCCEGDQVVALDSVDVLVVTGLVGAPDGVQDVVAEASSDDFLQFEDSVS